MKLAITIFFSAIMMIVRGQDSFRKVQRDTIEKETKDADADTYYPKLLNRFNNFDSSLSNEDYRLLYYGFVFQDNYAGDVYDKKTEIRSALQNKDYDLAIQICDTLLESDPVSLSANYSKAIALYLKDKDNTIYKKYGDRYKHLLDAIISSGNGLTCETSFKTICVNDEYEVIYNYFFIKKISGQSLIYPCDKISLTPSPYFGSKDMYFDTSESMMFMENLMKGNKKHHKKKRKRNQGAQ